MTPAEELLEAVKKHATAEVDFEFRLREKMLVILGRVRIFVFPHGKPVVWNEDVHGDSPSIGMHTHDSASSAVYSAFLRARK